MKEISKSRVITLLLAALCSAIALASSEFEGIWQGAINTPGQVLEIEVTFSDSEDGVTGKISIPVQGMMDFALSDIEAEGRSIQFAMAGIPGEPGFEGELSDDGKEISGNFTQGGGQFTFQLSAGLAGADVARKAMEGFDDFLDEVVKQFNVPGLAIAIVAGGELVYEKGAGYRDIDNSLPMTPDTLFAIGSTTKAMTSTLLGMLADDGKLSWDEPLTEYLPEFRLMDPMITARITPRDLVTHRSGLPRHDSLWYNNNSVSRKEMINRFEHLELTADLRERFQYNNLMYMTAGYLAGQLYGGTWESALGARLFKPLGMNRSNFSVADSARDENHARPYREKDDKLEEIPFRSIDLIGPAGSVNSSVREMSRWLLFNLNGGRVGDNQLITPAMLKDIHSPHMTTSVEPSAESRVTQQTYGMGWMVESYRGMKRLQHGGGIDGFITSVMLFPNDNVGLVAFNNRSSGLPSLVNQMAADRILGLEKVDWTGTAHKRMELAKSVARKAEDAKKEKRIKGTKPSHRLSDYIGHYRHEGYGSAMITKGEGKRGLRVEYNGIQAPLEHAHYDQWQGADTDGDPSFVGAQILFRADFEGNIAELSVPLELLASPVVFSKQPDPSMFDPEVLAAYTGAYLLESGGTGSVELAGNTLMVSVPGQPRYTLIPDVSGRFNLRGLQGYSVAFVEEKGVAVKLIFHQPNGVFEAKRQD
ncbi:MAG TPA: serine hydrolase [Pseudomonadales bacterium]|jgi:CubicO group peptidase (beta-lactamase class C family)|nr:serine hydrolase [Pseudomonadales bacterium]MDP6314939.1 serine hydrolase [Pseudomonadales bacterium]MDP7314817.1 serine hydrolase [Pseudomonadales bacterium]MDP7575968.1 serine hydrolase [Pseudomonadales bacterium]HJL61087.1 serine hydrolase [Pseudomonadales bacterium]|tara:strand:- start:11380 stop:13491 length:2112 start_codon:yes stop_codon:yes gene_type:complete